MTFLKKLGSFLVKGLALAAGIGPLVLPLFGSGKAGTIAQTGVNDFTAIGTAIVTIETAFAALPAGSTAAQKLAAALPLVTNIIKTSEIVAGKKIADEAKFTLGCTEITQGMVDILNGLHPDNVQSA